VAYLALFVAATGTASAATGGTFLLGTSNGAGHTTTLKNSGFGPALQLKTRSAHTAPLSVSGNTTKVPGLNADAVDGYSASQLQRKLTTTDICGSAGSINFVHANGIVRCGPSTYFAVVKADGTLARGSSGVTSAPLVAGTFEVDFPVDVTGCAYVADLGSPTDGPPASGIAGTASRVLTPNAVFVETRDSAFSLASESFHLVVVCPPNSR
jgi:hypothetical protein